MNLTARTGNLAKAERRLVGLAVCCLFVTLAFLINPVPTGKFIAGGDFHQIFNLTDNLYRYLFTWSHGHGQGSYNSLWVAFPYYFFIYLGEVLGLQPNQVASAIFFLFLSLSYFSFNLALRLLAPSINVATRQAGGVLYAVNNITLGIFGYSWGYTHHFIIYVFFPLLMALPLRLLIDRDAPARLAVLTGLVFIFSMPAYNNLAWLFTVFILWAFMIGLFILFNRGMLPGRVVARRVAGVSLFVIPISAIIVLPFMSANLPFSDNISSTAAFGGDALKIIRQTSNTLPKLFRLDFNGFEFSDHVTSLIYIAALMLILVVLVQPRRLAPPLRLAFWILFSIYMIILLLAVRLNQPFFFINSIIFSFKPFLLFRSPDKVLTVLPFFFFALLVIAIHGLKLSKPKILVVALVLLMAPVGFYLGDIKNRFSPAKRVNTTNYYAVEIPSQYFVIGEKISAEAGTFSVLSLPYSVINSLNWSNYPAWNFIGHDPFYLLLPHKHYISANAYDHPSLETELSLLGLCSLDNEAFLSRLQHFSAKYLLIHKDIDQRYLSDALCLIDRFSDFTFTGAMTLEASNRYFALYRISDDLFRPIVSASVPVRFARISPTTYRLWVRADQDLSLTFNQSYSPEWRLALVDQTSASAEQIARLDLGVGPTEIEGFSSWWTGIAPPTGLGQSFEPRLGNSYANQWRLDRAALGEAAHQSGYPTGAILEFVIYYRPQQYLVVGLTVFAVGMILLTVMAWRRWRRF